MRTCRRLRARRRSCHPQETDNDAVTLQFVGTPEQPESSGAMSDLTTIRLGEGRRWSGFDSLLEETLSCTEVTVSDRGQL